MKKINLWNIIAPIAIVVTTVFVIQFSRGWRYDLTKNTIVPTGILDITSDPRGVTIFLDGEEQGKSPKVIDSVSEGDHLLELRKDDYINWQTQVTVLSGKATKVEANLFEENTQLEQSSDTPIEDIVFSKNGNEAIVISKQKDNRGIWKVQLKTSFFTMEKTKVKLADLFEPDCFDLLQTSDYQITPSPDFSKVLLSVVKEGEGVTHRTFILDTSKSEITEITEYLYENVYPSWSDDSKYLIYNLVDDSIYTLKINNLQVSQIANRGGTITWTTMSNKIYFINEDIITNVKTLFSANTDGTNRTEIAISEIKAGDIKSLTSNPTHDTLIISTNNKTYTYEVSTGKLETIAEFELSPISLSPNQRFTLLIREKDKNVYSYDHEFSKLALAIENFELDTNLLTWAPNDLKLFYRFTDDDKRNVIKSLDANGSNKTDILILEDYSAKLDNAVGLSTDAKELYIPLISNVTATGEETSDTKEKVDGESEVIIYRLKLR